MRYGIISDIHSNLEALDAVLSVFAERDIDEYLSTGDLVGYGADPEACVKKVRELGTTVVAGNHDWAVADRLSLDYFNPYAREAIYWTQERLPDSDIRYLHDLPLTREVGGDTTLVHGTLYGPENFDYLLTSYDAHLSFQLMKTSLCLVGHSHVPITFILDGTVTFSFDQRTDLKGVEKAIINPGSVGQPLGGVEAVDWLHQVEGGADHVGLRRRGDQPRMRHVRVRDRAKHPRLAPHGLVAVLAQVRGRAAQDEIATAPSEAQQDVLGAAR